MSANTMSIVAINITTLPNGLIGSSQVLRNVSNSLRIVAPTDSAVLIQGETGTGKELVAKAIHEESARRHGPFVKVNCAAIPGGLLESELFGFERGAFTGALSQTVGRFERANTGTLFLDEIGDLALEVQPKLLRVLQEHEFERIGGNRTIRVDVRIIAATNHDLEQMVSESRFRADLFYRLNVFPITLPPLRERPEDIPPLVEHFVQMFARRMNKQVPHVPKKTLDVLEQHHWPGNIRELQNLIERAVIISSGRDLEIPSGEMSRRPKSANGTRTLAEVERDYILDVLRETNGVVGGENGAAVRLGLRRTTLLHRMWKLGITPGKAIRHRNDALPDDFEG